MICRLCLKDSTEVIQIFDVVGVELNVSIVLGKYFWFEPKNDDPISTSICNSCWIKVSDFHEFYLSVEEAHRLLTERFSIKREVKVNQQDRFSGRDTTETNLLKPSKSEPSEEDTKTQWSRTNENENTAKAVAEHDNDDEMELQFSVLLSDNENDDSLEVESVEDKKISLNSEDAAIEKDLESDLQQKAFESDNDEISLDEHYFVEKILNQAQRVSDEEELIKEEPLDTSELRRSTRHMQTKKIVTEKSSYSRNTRRTAWLQKINASESCYDDSKEVELSDIKTKRRGRPRRSNENKQHTTVRKSVSDTRIAIERKSKENDEKIAGYMRLVCQICSTELPTFATLRIHYTNEHNENAYVICCNKKFYKRVLLVEHIDKHLDPECYKCSTCNKIFADKQCVRNHMLLKHQPDEVKTYGCEQCPKKFAKPYLLEQHLIVHAERTHICSICDKKFPSAPQLTSHIKVTHSNTYGTMCHICAKLIRGRAAFERHQLEHAGVKLPKVQCQKCGSWHKDKYSLQKHVRRHNEDGTVHICSICRKVAPNRSALLAHCRYVHAAERTYECSVCKKAFKKPLSLREHMTTHTGEVLYSCPYCPKTFNSNANMHSHRKKMHPREFEEQRKLRRGQNASDVSEETSIIEDLPHNIIASITNEDADDVSIILTAS